MLVFVTRMFHKLIFTIVPYTTSITLIWLLVGVSPFMIISVSNRCEPFNTMFTLVRFFSCMNSHVH